MKKQHIIEGTNTKYRPVKPHKNMLFYPFVFTGKERDGETGYSYFGARYYDSDLFGFFLSVDPMSDKYTSISPYAYCAWKPLRLVDPDGREFDPTTEKKYISHYEKEIHKRMELIDKTRGTGKWNPEYQLQYDEYNKILSEINELRNDENNIYTIITGVCTEGENSAGEIRFAGNKDGKNQINIRLASRFKNAKLFMCDIAHELKHAYQFFDGKLTFFCDENMKQISSSDTKALEREANIRGDMFIDCVTNGRPMKYDYSLDPGTYVLPSSYDGYPKDESEIIAVGKYEIKNTRQKP